MSLTRLQSISEFPVMKNYRLTDKLGTGTFATVYKAHKKVILLFI